MDGGSEMVKKSTSNIFTNANKNLPSSHEIVSGLFCHTKYLKTAAECLLLCR